MKINKGLTGFAAVSLLSAALVSCSSVNRKQLAATNINPAGEGTVSIKNDPNRNTALEVEVNHLAPPERISTNATTYIVWVAPTANPDQATNLGALQVGEDRSGKFAAVTPLKSFDLFITAEPSATQSMPTGERMFWTQVNNTRTG